MSQKRDMGHPLFSRIANGSGIVAISTAAAATASLQEKTLIVERRKINKDIRENVLEWMDKNGYNYMKGSQANFFQVDVKRPGPEFAATMTKEHIHIGRTWAAMPNYSRITVGTQEEMDKFKVAFKKCYDMPPRPFPRRSWSSGITSRSWISRTSVSG